MKFLLLVIVVILLAMSCGCAKVDPAADSSVEDGSVTVCRSYYGCAKAVPIKVDGQTCILVLSGNHDVAISC